jgi:hypothetical protein
MCGEIDEHGLVDEGEPYERPCLVGAYERLKKEAEAWEAREAQLVADRKRLEEAERNIGERKHIDATPNDGYPSRILQAYRNDCDLRYSESTGGVVASTPFTRAMNDLQDQRAAILDRALAALAAGEETT